MLNLDPDILSNTEQSPYRRALDQGHPLLRFGPPLEEEFQRFYLDGHLSRIRWGACIALALFALFVWIDLNTMPLHVARITAGIRAGVIMPMFALGLFVTFRPTLRAWVQPAVFLASLVTGLGVVAIIGVGLRMGAAIPYEGLLLISLFTYLAVGQQWWWAVAANVVILLAFVVVQLALEPDALVRMYHLVFMLAANAIGAYGGYFLEHRSRTMFLGNGLLNELAERDGLTGIFNRRTLNSHLDKLWRQAIREEREVAVAMVDIDHFKRYNDRYGHTQGDAALQAVAGVIARQARRPLDLGARYGGEEFAVVWFQPAASELSALGEQLREGVEQLGLEHADSDNGTLTVSVGIALMRPVAGQSNADLMRAADTALYQAKQSGRNRVVVLDHPSTEAILFKPDQPSTTPER